VRKKTGYRTQLFGPLKLYREEIEELVTLFKNSCERVELADEKYVYDSLEEMGNRLGKNIVSLAISGVRPYASVEVGAKKVIKWGRRDQNYIYADEEDKAQILFLKARDILLDHKRWILPRIFNWPIWYLVTVINYAFALPPLFHRHLFPSPGVILRGSVFGSVLTYYCFFGYFQFFRGMSYLSLESRTKQQSFLARNRDAILLLLLGAAAAEAIHWFVSRLSH
jgi:hypothetical protein